MTNLVCPSRAKTMQKQNKVTFNFKSALQAYERISIHHKYDKYSEKTNQELWMSNLSENLFFEIGK